MMRRVLMSGAAALFALMFTGVAASQGVPADEEPAGAAVPELARYHVEVIVFVNDDLDSTEELFEYQAQRHESEPLFPSPAPVMRPLPELVWSYPEDEENGPAPGFATLADSIFAPVLELPTGRPQLVLEEIRRPLPELKAVPGFVFGPDGLFDPARELEALPETPPTEVRALVIPPLLGLFTEAGALATPLLLELPDPTAELPPGPPVPPPDQLVLDQPTVDQLTDDQLLEDQLQEDQLAASAGTEPVARYADELDREFTYVPDGAGAGRTFRYRVLRGEELQLADAYARIQRLGAYRPLLHAGWSQEALGETETAPLELSRLGAVNPTGTIQLHLQRFLHLTLDLDYRFAPRRLPYFESQIVARAIEPPAAPGRRASSGSAGLSEIKLAPHYYIEENRRTRSSELNYFDHPAFGVLMLVTPAPEASEATDGDTQDGRPAA